eukprot:TRINITY_DN98_c0_g1_i3.p1 TRINITY_DN98_c0_g1~~TRINITY_DN98_c0_g1_i3.p1  ORF type:complete len:291 (+),score=20.92 TRINITY_DN98_c0_g1_i3:25-873(+)
MLHTLGKSVPEESTFYINYILNAAFFGLGLEMANLGRFVSICFFGPQEQTPMYYYIGYPQIIMIFTVCVTYAAISPIILIWGLLYFFLAHIISKHQILYVHKIHRFSQLWKHWPTIYQRLHIGLLIGIVVMVGVFSLKEAIQQIPCLIAFGALVYGHCETQLDTFAHYFKQPCLDSCWEHDMMNGPQEWQGNNLYLPDCIRELRRKRPRKTTKSSLGRRSSMGHRSSLGRPSSVYNHSSAPMSMRSDTLGAPLLSHRETQGPQITPPSSQKRLPVAKVDGYE